MRFRNFNFTETCAEQKKLKAPRSGVKAPRSGVKAPRSGVKAPRSGVKAPRSGLALAALFMCLCPLIANAQAVRIKGYAVQVAALSSRESAEELVRGLGVRGISAYWVKGSAGPVHRVRIGNFPTIASAHNYAEKLQGSGLLDAYAIAAYEPPPKGVYISNGKVQSFAQKYQGRQFNADTIDLVTAVGTRGWLLLSSKSVDLTLRQGRQLNPALSLELTKLTAFVGSRGWAFNSNVTKLLSPDAPADIANLASTRNWTISNAAGAPASVAPNKPAPPPVASSTSLSASAPDIGRAPLTPVSSTGLRPVSSSKVFTTPPRLQGSLEMRDGRMWMTLRNVDADRSFTGVARITLSDDKNQQDVTPKQITLQPDGEESFPVDEATVKDGSWILMVYDQNGAARLIRGASFPAPPAPPQTPGAPNSPGQPNTVQQNPAPQAPPSYVTGVYDATGYPQAPNPLITQESAPQNSNPAPGADPNAQASALPPQIPQPEVVPGQVGVTPRQIAVTPENVTIELEITAQSPLNYIMVTLRAGDFQDVRQALVSTPQGRVPFLIPAEFARGGFIYEVKDEAQRVLASGSGDFRQIAKGN